MIPTYPALTRPSDGAIPVFLVTVDQWPETDAVPARLQAAAKAQGFKASAGQLVQTASEGGVPDGVLFGLGDGQDGLAVASLSARLLANDYQIMATGGLSFDLIAAGWVDGAYRFDRYLASEDPPRLVIPDGEDAASIISEAVAIRRLRDMVNTPAEDMGPAAIEAEVQVLAETYGAQLVATVGEALLAENYPMIHAVGRAGPQPPRLIELSWGDPTAPELAIVGKGVAFDTGGLNLKTGNYMRLMKKDMGGAAHAIALAELVMAASLPVHLRLYVPAVENAISGTAFRPGDILSSRKGLHVEIDNTDAEGRLVLGDALTRASETDPDLIIDFATLTGAARVALGPDLAPFYTEDDDLAASIEAGARDSGDPAWRMPLWAPYMSALKSPIADLVNSASDGMGGSITAALFLQNFVAARRWVHFDIWSWRKAKYGRPEGAAACGLRASWRMLQTRYRSAG